MSKFIEINVYPIYNSQENSKSIIIPVDDIIHIEEISPEMQKTIAKNINNMQHPEKLTIGIPDLIGCARIVMVNKMGGGSAAYIYSSESYQDFKDKLVQNGLLMANNEEVFKKEI